MHPCRVRAASLPLLILSLVLASLVAPPAAAQTAPVDGAWEVLPPGGPGGALQGVWSDALVVLDDAADVVWDFRDGAWRRHERAGQAAPPGVRGAAVAAAGGRLWVYGGRTSAGADRGELWSWAAATGWRLESAEFAAGVPGPRSDAMMTTDGRALYLYGGRRGGTLRDDFWRFDTHVPGWTRLPDCRSNCPGPRANAAFAAMQGALWLHGGETEDGRTAALHRVTGDGVWEAVAAGRSTPLVANHGLVAAGGSLLAVGGCTAAGTLTWRYQPGAGWVELHPAAIAPATADAAVAWDGTRVHRVGGTPCASGDAPPVTHYAFTPGPGEAGRRTERVAAEGGDAVTLGAAVSRRVFPARGAAVAALGTAVRFPDSLAGTALLGGPGGARGPLLFTAPDGLSAATRDELQRAVQPNATVYLLGGETALGAQVARDVEALGLRPQRLSGATRVETSVAIGREAARLRGADAPPDRVLLADARQFADAVAAGGYAAAGAPIPVLLTPGDATRLHPAVAQALADLRIGEVVLLGGRAALSEGIEQDVRARGLRAVRVAGASRDGTAAEIAATLWGRAQRGQGYHFVAVDLFDPERGWAAALAAAPLGATARAPLLALNAAAPDGLPPATVQYLESLDFHPDRPGYAFLLGPAPAAADERLRNLLQ